MGEILFPRGIAKRRMMHKNQGLGAKKEEIWEFDCLFTYLPCPSFCNINIVPKQLTKLKWPYKIYIIKIHQSKKTHIETITLLSKYYSYLKARQNSLENFLKGCSLGKRADIETPNFIWKIRSGEFPKTFVDVTLLSPKHSHPSLLMLKFLGFAISPPPSLVFLCLLSLSSITLFLT